MAYFTLATQENKPNKFIVWNLSNFAASYNFSNFMCLRLHHPPFIIGIIPSHRSQILQAWRVNAYWSVQCIELIIIIITIIKSMMQWYTYMYWVTHPGKAKQQSTMQKSTQHHWVSDFKVFLTSMWYQAMYEQSYPNSRKICNPFLQFGN